MSTAQPLGIRSRFLLTGLVVTCSLSMVLGVSLLVMNHGGLYSLTTSAVTAMTTIQEQQELAMHAVDDRLADLIDHQTTAVGEQLSTAKHQLIGGLEGLQNQQADAMTAAAHAQGRRALVKGATRWQVCRTARKPDCRPVGRL